MCAAAPSLGPTTRRLPAPSPPVRRMHECSCSRQSLRSGELAWEYSPLAGGVSAAPRAVGRVQLYDTTRARCWAVRQLGTLAAVRVRRGELQSASWGVRDGEYSEMFTSAVRWRWTGPEGGGLVFGEQSREQLRDGDRRRAKPVPHLARGSLHNLLTYATPATAAVLALPRRRVRLEEGRRHMGAGPYLTAFNAVGGNHFGKSVSISGNIVVIGAPGRRRPTSSARPTARGRWWRTSSRPIAVTARTSRTGTPASSAAASARRCRSAAPSS